MIDFRQCFKNNQYDSVVDDLIEQAKDITSIRGEDAYWLAKCIYEASSEEDTDDYVIDSILQALKTGINLSTDREKFLDAAQILSRLYIRRNDYIRAINYLMDLSDCMDPVPDWVNLYYVMAQILTDNIYRHAEDPVFLYRRLDSVSPDSYVQRAKVYQIFLKRLHDIEASGTNRTLNIDVFEGLKNKYIGNYLDDLDAVIMKEETEEELETTDAEKGVPEEEPEVADTEVEAECEITDIEKHETEKEREITDTKDEEVPKPDEAYIQSLVETRISATEQEHKNEIEELRKQIAERDSLIAEKDNAIAEKDSAIAERDSVIAQRDTAISDLQQKVKDRESALVQIRTGIQERPAKEETQAEDEKKLINLHRNEKILVIGALSAKPKEIIGISKLFGLKEENLEIFSDYEKITNFGNRILPGTYRAIIIGPSPHSVKGNEGENSLADRILSHPDDYPYAVRCEDESGRLRISKTSYKKSLTYIARMMDVV